MEWQDRLLEELIYDRVRLHVDLLDLIDFESDLGHSIGRALRASGADASDEAGLARRYIDRAWRRVEDEWVRVRAGKWTECPLCEGPLECEGPIECSAGSEIPGRAALAPRDPGS